MGRKTAKQRRVKRKQWVDALVPVATALEHAGLMLRLGLPPAGKRGAPHWMIEENGKRVLDYWPTTGRWWCAALNRRGTATMGEIATVAWELAQTTSPAPFFNIQDAQKPTP